MFKKADYAYHIHALIHQYMHWSRCHEKKYVTPAHHQQDAWTVHTEYREIDGSDNNANYDSTGAQFLRMAPSDYGNSLDTPSGANRPSAREISNEVFDQSVSVPSDVGMSAMGWVWGQFIDHDLDLTAGATIPEPFFIEVPVGDPHFDPNSLGGQTIMLFRSGYDPTTGGASGVPREQVNEITPFLDGSVVYGSDQIRNDFIRGEDGKLKVSDGDLLPYNTDGLPNAPVNSPNLFLAGDVRANENAGLISMQTLFVREHNYWVDRLKADHPGWDAERLYQEAKVIVEAELQAITYNEFLPILLGENALSEYSGYDASVDPEIANIFATAAYRLGHTMLNSQMLRVQEDGSESAYGHLLLKQAFFNPTLISHEGGIDEVLRGIGVAKSEAIDTLMIDDVRNFLFGEPGMGGFDLAALNIQRGRDHGLPDYNSAREAYGLDKVLSFTDITDDVAMQMTLESLYGSVDNIDVFVGGLAEDEFGDSLLGELFHTVLVDQFTRIRDGDLYWYENRLTDKEIDKINDTTLSDIIVRNTDIEHMQTNVFYAYNRMGGTDGKDTMKGTHDRDLMIGFNGNDTLKGRKGDDELFGGKGNDKLYGNKGDDILHGGYGKDKLYGGRGNDILDGGYGNDVLKGQGGADIFVFGNHFGRDKVLDFRGQDKLDFSDLHIELSDLNFKSYHNKTVITVDGHWGNSVMLMGVHFSDLGEDDFIF